MRLDCHHCLWVLFVRARMLRLFDHRFGYFFLSFCFFIRCPEREWRALFVRVLLLISGDSLFVVIIVLISSSCSNEGAAMELSARF